MTRLNFLKRAVFTAGAVLVFSSCGDKDVPNETPFNKTVNADETTGKSGVTFVASGVWTPTITEGTTKSTKFNDFYFEEFLRQINRLDSIEQKMLKDGTLVTEDEMFGTVHISVYNHKMSETSFKEAKEHDGKITKILRETRFYGEEKTIFTYSYEN